MHGGQHRTVLGLGVIGTLQQDALEEVPSDTMPLVEDALGEFEQQREPGQRGC